MARTGRPIIAQARTRIGLVPQELTHRRVRKRAGNTVSFSRGLFGRPRDPAQDRGHSSSACRCGTSARRDDASLSGGMKRRVMIAKALSHEPDILFLDEPTAGVDVELRRDMWDLVREPRAATARPSS